MDKIHNVNDQYENNELDDIAIIGMSCRFPGAPDIDAFWNVISEGKCTIANDFNSGQRPLDSDSYFVPNQGVLEEKNKFDSPFFGISPHEALTIDPQHRIFLECSWTALEDAGIVPENNKAVISVFAGTGMNYHFINNLLQNKKTVDDAIDILQFIGNEKDFLTTRVSHKLGLTGQSVTVQSACSTALVAVHLGCTNLYTYQSDIAICGAVSIQSPKVPGYQYKKGEIFSAAGEIRTFDKNADGTLFGEGCGVVILKRLGDALKDNDRIHCIIKSSAVNNDGNRKVGYTAPSIQGQVDCISAAMDFGEIHPQSIGYIETHGTGTALGDSIEISALKEIFKTDKNKDKTCYIGSVKPNIGHIDVAAGLAGLIKSVLILKNKIIPPQIHYSEPNPNLGLDDSPFKITQQPVNWSNDNTVGSLRRAGVSSFGMGGTNAHVILEEYNTNIESAISDSHHLITLSAKTSTSLQSMKNKLRLLINKKENDRIPDISYTLLNKRKSFPIRWFGIYSKDKNKIISEYEDHKTTGKKEIVFIFPGQGSQYIQMTYSLYSTFTGYRKYLDQCFTLFKKSLEIDLKKHLFHSSLQETSIVQATLFSVEYSLAMFLMDLGIVPSAVAGHSFGEIAAATVAGIFTLEDAVNFVSFRGSVFSDLPEGKMIAIDRSVNETKKFLDENVWISAINSETQTVVSGLSHHISKLEAELTNKNIQYTLLKNKHPFHTPLMNDTAQKIHKYLEGIVLGNQYIRILSNVTGTWNESKDMSTPSYWSSQLENTVQFSKISNTLNNLSNTIIIEIGPGKVLSTLVQFNGQHKKSSIITTMLSSSEGEKEEVESIYTFLGRIWREGVDLDFAPLFQDKSCRVVSCTPYSFDRHVVEKVADNIINFKEIEKQNAAEPEENLSIGKYWKDSLGYNKIQAEDNFFSLGGNSLIAAEIISKINRNYKMDLNPSILYKYSTLAQFSNYIVNLNRESNQESGLIKMDSSPEQSGILSPQQKRLWFFHEYNPRGFDYNLTHIIKISQQINIKLLKKAIHYFLSRHEAFYSYINKNESLPELKVSKEMKVPIKEMEVIGNSYNERLLEFQKIIKSELHTSIDFTQYPICQVIIGILSERDIRVVLFIPHIFSDGWSAEIFRKELKSIYKSMENNREIKLPLLPIKYSDYSLWQKSSKKQSICDKDKNFWKEYLQNIPIVHQIPLDYERPTDLSGNGDSIEFRISVETSKKIKDICEYIKITPFVFFLSTLSLLIGKYSNQESIAVGTPYANRGKKEIKDIIGLFVKTLPIRIDINDRKTISDFFSAVKDQFFLSWSNSENDLDQIVDSIGLERFSGINPIFQVIFAYQSYMNNLDAQNQKTFSLEYSNRGISEFDLSLYMWEENGFKGSFEYSTDLFFHDSIKRIVDHFCNLVEKITKNVDQKISDICLLTSKDKKTQLIQWNKTDTSNFEKTNILSYFTRRTKTDGDKIAIIHNNNKISYRRLNEYSNQIAHYLISMGIKKGDRIGLCIQRNIDMISSVLGILKTGSAYIPLDPDFPTERLMYMINHSKLEYIISEENILEKLPISSNVNKILLQRDKSSIANQIKDFPDISISFDDISYIIYTSGSTGMAKGIQIKHKALLNFLLSMKKNPGITKEDKVLALTTLSFDISCLEIFLPLISGSTLILADTEISKDIERLITYINRNGTTIMQATPAMYQMLLDSEWTPNPSIKLLCGGEAMPTELSQRLQTVSNHVWNMYGPTETTIWSSIYKLNPSIEIPLIGKPIDNTQMYILDKNLQPLPIGVIGDLYIGGEGLSAGYLYREELTEQMFIKHPFVDNPQSKIYKTGDLCKYLPDGNIVYIGRSDFQIKLRGYRIELGEIESVLNQYPGIEESICNVHKINETDKRIIAYLKTDNPIENNLLRKFLCRKLPDYMVPKQFVLLKALPLSANGKIDRNALPIADLESISLSTREITHPKNGFESEILEIWKVVLKRNDIGIRDNFFDLGGHSLLASTLINQMNIKLKRKWLLRDLFRSPTIEELTSLLSSNDIDGFPLFFPVRQNGSKKPFYLVAGVYDNLYYNNEGDNEYEKDFLRYFSNIITLFSKERPIFGLRPQGILPGEFFHKDVEAMADEYVLELKKLQPLGPYIIGGECLGGIIAYEIAQKLQKQGDEVELLVLLDTYKTDKLFETSYYLMNLLRRYKRMAIKLIKILLKFPDFHITHSFITNIKEFRKEYIPINESEKEVHSIKRGSWRFAIKIIKYRPKKYTGDVLLIINSDWNCKNPNLNWNSKICPNISIHEVPGSHTSRLQEYGKSTGDILNRYLKNSQ